MKKPGKKTEHLIHEERIRMTCSFVTGHIARTLKKPYTALTAADVVRFSKANPELFPRPWTQAEALYALGNPSALLQTMKPVEEDATLERLLAELAEQMEAGSRGDCLCDQPPPGESGVIECFRCERLRWATALRLILEERTESTAGVGWRQQMLNDARKVLAGEKVRR